MKLSDKIGLGLLANAVHVWIWFVVFASMHMYDIAVVLYVVALWQWAKGIRIIVR